MKKFKTRLMAILLVFPLTITGCNNNDSSNGRNDRTEIGADSESKRSKKGTKFENMVYEHMELTDYYELIDSISDLCKDEEKSDEVLKKFDKMYTMYTNMGTNCTLASLYNSIDYSDQYYIDEYEYSYEAYLEMYDKLLETARVIADSACSDAAREYWGDALYNSFTMSTTDTVVKELLLKESELIKQYTDIMYGDEIANELAINDLEPDEKEEEYDEAYLKKMNEAVAPIYIELIKVRNDIAKRYGYSSYAEYSYANSYYRDYTPQDALEYSKNVKEKIVPLFKQLYLENEVDNFEALDRHFSKMSDDKQLNILGKYLERLDTTFVDAYNYMMKYDLYNISASDTKVAGGFTVYIDGYSSPFIYNKPEGDFYDMMSLEHEFGHFYEYYVTSGYANSSIDISEIYSQSLELIYTNFYAEEFSEKVAQSAVDYTLMQRLNTIIEGCLYDEFQQIVYAMEEPTVEKINKVCCELYKEYGLIASDDGAVEEYDWIMVTHNFSQPMYYISYAVSVAPAFELWKISMEDLDKAVDIYKNMINEKESLTYTELLEKNGLVSPFEDEMLDELADTLRKYYGI